MAIASALGIGSGMDISGIVGQLIQAEGQPAYSALNRQASAVNSRLSGLGQLKSALSTFQESVKTLQSDTIFKSYTASSSNEDIATVTSDSKAVGGSYAIEVTQLARAQKEITSNEYTDASDTVGIGTLDITVGSNTLSLTIDSSNNSLSGLRDAINDSTDNPGITASIINVDGAGGGTVSKLVFSSKEVGVDNGFTITATGDADLTSLDTSITANYDTVAAVAARDSIIEVDGQTATRSSNVLSDIIQGVTLELKSESVGTTFNIDISLDKEAVSAAVTSFVSAYNSLHGVMKKLGASDPDSESKGTLAGDSLLRSADSLIRQSFSNPVTSATSSDNSLVSLGIEIDQFGVMSADSSQLGDIMDHNLNAMIEVFSSSDGVAVRLEEKLDQFLKSDGRIDSQTKSLSKQQRRIDESRDAVDLRMENMERVLMKQFISMDMAVGQYQSTGSYLAQQIAQLNR